jgi:SRSO17 transposase
LPRFFPLLHRNNKSVQAYFLAYIFGLLLCEKKKENMQVISKKIGVDYQGLHNFISHSPWCHKAMINETAKLTYSLFKKYNEPIVLAIDETSFLKKGSESVGVGHQYLGSEGKTANGQVVVFSALVQGTNCNLAQCELFVPESFASDADRMEKVGLDAKTFVFKTKNQLAKEQISQLVALDIKADLVVADAAYGADTSFRKHCKNEGLNYLLSLKEGNAVWFEEPENDKIKRKKITEWLFEIDNNTVSKRVKIVSNKSTVGAVADMFSLPVWTMDISTKEIQKEWLVILSKKGVQSYLITNIEVTMDNIDLITYYAGRRYFIERSFQNGKQLHGMSGYQVRKYRAMMHHMAAVCVLGLQFLEELYAEINEKPKASYEAIAELYKYIILAHADLRATALRDTKRYFPEKYDALKQSFDDNPEI